MYLYCTGSWFISKHNSSYSSRAAGITVLKVLQSCRLYSAAETTVLQAWKCCMSMRGLKFLHSYRQYRCRKYSATAITGLQAVQRSRQNILAGVAVLYPMFRTAWTLFSGWRRFGVHVIQWHRLFQGYNLFILLQYAFLVLCSFLCSFSAVGLLKGQCHQIFHLCFFSSNNFSWPQ